MRGNAIINNISKLNTFVNMYKSCELLKLYIAKIIDNKSKNIDFNDYFDYIALDLLCTSLEISDESGEITAIEYAKLDKKELSYYIKKVKGINFFKKQVPAIKSEETLVSYLKEALERGSYVCNHNNTVRFDNGLVIDSKWVIEFSKFLITSLNINKNLSSDATTYIFNTVELPEGKYTDVNKFIKEIKQYEYSVTRKDGELLSYQDVKYLLDKLVVIKKYDFKKLQEINSDLAKDKYALSVNKKIITFSKEEKGKIEKLLNEETDRIRVNEFIKDTLNCYNSASSKNKRRLFESFEIVRSLIYAYKGKYSMEDARKIFSYKERKEDIENALTIASFYINYIYDETNLLKNFNYALLELEEIKPSIIDYETPEYKAILKNLSVLNKKVVNANRRINKYLDEAKNHPKNDLQFIEENNQGFSRNCRDLERIVKKIKEFREELENTKDQNRHQANRNKTKLKYIKEAIISGHYLFDKEELLLVFDCFSKEDYHRTFHLEISLEEFKSIILSEHNCEVRMDFYQIEQNDL